MALVSRGGWGRDGKAADACRLKVVGWRETRRPGGGGSRWLPESRRGWDEEELAAEIGAGRAGKDKTVDACDQGQDSCGIEIRAPTRMKA
jgi:hypothetical protein